MIDFFITDKDMKKHKEKVIDWAYKIGEIDKFWIQELEELINYGGENIVIRLSNGNKIKGILSGVNMDYIELNGSIKIILDNINSIYIGTDPDKNDKIKQND